MNNFFHKAKQEIKLSYDEKALMRAHLARYGEAHPIQYISPFARVRTKKVLAGTVMLSMLLGSSVSFAAGDTNPGDTLYPVKIYVNEPARGALILNENAQADWEVELAERRLREVEALEDKNTPDVVRERARNNFDIYASRVASRVEKLEGAGKHEQALLLAQKFAGRVRSHEEKLSRKEAPPALAPAVATTTEKSLAPVLLPQRERAVTHTKNLERVRVVRERIEAKEANLKERAQERASHKRF